MPARAVDGPIRRPQMGDLRRVPTVEFVTELIQHANPCSLEVGAGQIGTDLSQRDRCLPVAALLVVRMHLRVGQEDHVDDSGELHGIWIENVGLWWERQGGRPKGRPSSGGVQALHRGRISHGTK